VTNRRSEFDFGVVTFLDILGWKGIWERKQNPLEPLDKIVEILREELSKEFNHDVISISDTIALFTKSIHPSVDESKLSAFMRGLNSRQNVNRMVIHHGFLISNCLSRSIEYEIPIRGATCIGEFKYDEGRFLGPAVDEAAEWYETADWIGVHLTPSAFFYVGEELENWVNYSPPFKKGPSWETLCANWTNNWGLDLLSIGIEGKVLVDDRKFSLEQKFFEFGPIGPDIAGKFTNTLKFFDEFANDEVTTG